MKIYYKDKEYEVKEGETIQEVLQEEIRNSEYTVIGALFNNEYENLGYEIKEEGKIDLIDISTREGMKIYKRTLTYLLGKAFEKLFPGKKMEVNYQLSNSMFCEAIDMDITEDMIKKLNDEMKVIVDKDLPIQQVVMNREEAKEFFDKEDTSKGRLQLDLKDNKKIYMYYCEEYYNYCYGTLANRTGCVKLFEVKNIMMVL